MKGDALCTMSLSEAARAVARREVSSRALTEACLNRIEHHGEALHCIARIDPDAALRAADEADATLAKSGPRGLLHGVPLAHKDMFFRAGRAADCGSRIMAGHVPEVTSSALAHLDAAGALDIAQLHMVEFALGTTGHNEITGTPRNPWNTEYITGGSSSGSGAAVAARLVFAALGSDTGGSIRLPAACCGLVGLKPTYGRVSRAGAMPLSFTLDHIGPLTRTVEDAALMLQVLAGADPADPTTPQEPVPDYRAGLNAGVRGLRIALPETYFYDKTDPEVAALARASLDVLEKLGATIVPVRLPEEFALANAMSVMITVTEAAAYHARWLRERPDDYGRQTLGRMLPGLLYPATRYIEALNLRARILNILEEHVFAKADILHTPVWPIPVPSIAESDVAANPGFMEFLTLTGHCVRPFNYTGLPAMSVPIGRTNNGLPSAMQLIGRPFDEATLFRAAAAYERETGCTAEAPPL